MLSRIDSSLLQNNQRVTTWSDRGQQAIELVLGGIGLCAVSLYWRPAWDCSADEKCAKWLSDLTSEEFCVAVLMGSAVMSFGMVSAYFGTRSFKTMVDFFQKRPHLRSKVFGVLALTGICSLHAVGAFIGSSKTNGTALAIALSVAGSTPTSLYAAIGLLEERFPHWQSIAGVHWREFKWKINTLTSEDEMARLRQRFYVAQLKHIQLKARQQMQALIAEVQSYYWDEDDEVYDILFAPRQIKEETKLEYYLRLLATILGLCVSIPVSMPFLWLMVITVAEHDVPTIFLQYMIAVLINTPPMYANMDVIDEGMQGVVTVGKSLICREPLQSLPYQLRPVLTGVNFVADILIALPSVALLFAVSIQSYNGPEKDAFVKYIMASIITYHFFGQMNFYNMLSAKFPSGEKEKFLYAIQDTVEKLQRMPLKEFIALVEGDDERFKLASDVRPFPKLPEPNKDSRVSQIGNFGRQKMQPFSIQITPPSAQLRLQ